METSQIDIYDVKWYTFKFVLLPDLLFHNPHATAIFRLAL